MQRTVQELGSTSAQIQKVATDLETIAAVLAEAQRAASDQIAQLESRLQQIDDQLGQAFQLEARGLLTEEDQPALDALIHIEDQDAIDCTATTLHQVNSIRTAYSDTLQTSLAALRTDGYEPGVLQAVDASGTPSRAEPESNRRQNEIEAFTKVFGRPPSSAADWDTAEALDPHSYNPKNGGVPPNIIVSRITPVPGQGVVRTNLFIPSRTVWNPELDWPPYHENLGDNRGFSPTADPEASRISVFVDYENGIIVARQNPSIDPKAGQIRAGTPAVSAVQQKNGAISITYSGADPFSPGGEDLAKATSLDVNGTIVIEPTATGPRVGGTVTDFPAIEIYNDRSGAPTTLVHSWPTYVDDELGPMAGLWWHKPIGDESVEPHFNAQP
ncbi:MAG: hypothetical protein JO236_09055 [Mycobacterium sp.]|nr:hypothetical protein [Mycobacterium sp.]